MLEERSELDHDTARALVERCIHRIPNMTISSSEALDHLLARSGVIRSPAEGKIDFVHRTFQEFLAAREAAESGHVNLLLEHASSDQWRETIIMASTLLNRSLRANLIDGLFERSGTGPNGRRLSLLAAACKDAASDLPSEILHRVDRAMRSLTPPLNHEHAVELAELGDPIIDHLPRSPEGLTAEQMSPCITTAAMVGGDGALDLLANYARFPRPDIHAVLLRHWKFFDAGQYAQEVLGHFSLRGATVPITEPSQLGHLARRRDVSSVEVDLTGHEISDLSILSSVPLIEQIRVSITGAVDLDPLRVHQKLLRLTITDADHIHNVHVLEDLISLYQLNIHNEDSLNDLSFLERLHGLEGLSLGKLTRVRDYSPLHGLKNLRWLSLQNCPWIGDLHDIAHLTKLTRLELTGCEYSDVTTAVARHFPNLRSLILDGARSVDLAPLTSLPLEELSVNHTDVEDLSPIQEMTKLSTIMIGDCAHVKDVTPLARLPELRYTDVSRTAPETDLLPLTYLQGTTLAMTPGQDRRKDGKRLQRGPGVKIVYT